MWDSLKQLYRRPVKLILFFLLTAVSTVLLILGVSLWSETSKKLAFIQQSFTTIVEGREITPQEFEEGAPVCLVTKQFAQLNGLRVGDRVELPLFIADYRFSPGYGFGLSGDGSWPTTMLNAQGEIYSPFWTGSYEIVGFYRHTGVGLLSSLAILVLLAYFFVVRQKKQTAIQRSLGAAKRQCRVSLLSGIMILTLLGVTAGSLGSAAVGTHLSGSSEPSGEAYSMKYSNWVRQETGGVEIEQGETAGSTLPNVVIPSLLLLFTFALSLVLVNQNLRIEPIRRLSNREE